VRQLTQPGIAATACSSERRRGRHDRGTSGYCRGGGSQIEVILDGGIRRGVQIVKALALGATACSIGRPYLFGLSAGAEAGVTKALRILRTELVRTMQLCGCTDIGKIERSLVRRR